MEPGSSCAGHGVCATVFAPQATQVSAMGRLAGVAGGVKKHDWSSDYGAVGGEPRYGNLSRASAKRGADFTGV